MARLVRARPPLSRATVSVVIPCYNYGRYLPECVASVLDQGDVDVEIIVVDDASTDGSAEVARALAAGEKRITLIENATNQGLIPTCGVGLAAATADFVLLLSADDLLTPGALRRAVAVLQRHPGVGLVYGPAAFFHETPPPAATRELGWTIWTGAQWLRRASRLGRNTVATPTAVMRTSVLRAAGGYEATLPHTSDMYLWLCAAALSDIAMINWCHQGYVRQHGANMSATTFGERVTDLEQRRRTFDLLLARWQDRLPAARRYHAAAIDSLARESLRAACEHYDRGLPGVTDPAELADLAARLRPAIRGSRLWRAYERRAARQSAGRRFLRRHLAHARRRVGWVIRRLGA